MMKTGKGAERAEKESERNKKSADTQQISDKESYIVMKGNELQGPPHDPPANKQEKHAK